LRRPQAPPSAGRLALATLAGAACYGLAAGFFQGGVDVLVAALKAPLIVATAVLLCLPSFVVFHLLGGDEQSVASLARQVVAFAAVAALLLAALTPVGWLFSVTSRSLGFAVLFHLVVWGVALGFGLRHLFAALPAAGSRSVSVVWSILFWFVSVQLCVYLGPVLTHRAGEPLFPLERASIATRLEDLSAFDRQRRELGP
jgi:hypothetical protein